MIITKYERDVAGDKKLWAAHMTVKFEDAIYPFRIPVKKQKKNSLEIPSIKKQYDIFAAKKVLGEPLPRISRERNILIPKGRVFLESSHFDEIIEDIGYGSEFVVKSFKMAQEATILRRKLYGRYI